MSILLIHFALANIHPTVFIIFSFLKIYRTVYNEMCMQLQDLAKAFVQVLGNEKASQQVFNISGEKYVTFDGLARACAKVSDDCIADRT